MDLNINYKFIEGKDETYASAISNPAVPGSVIFIPEDTGFWSYSRLLRKYIHQKKPKYILEWGPGYSTILMMNEAPHAEIYTIESEEKWHNFYYPVFIQEPRVHMYLLSLDGNYVTAPLAFIEQLKRKFDFVFVDGTDDTRADCLQVTTQVLADDGVVLLHDSERMWYWPPIRKYFMVVEEYILEKEKRQWNRTVALKLKKT